MEYLSAEGQFFRDLAFEQPGEEPKILVANAVVLIDPVAAAAIGRPLAEALLRPDG